MTKDVQVAVAVVESNNDMNDIDGIDGIDKGALFDVRLGTTTLGRHATVASARIVS